MNVKGNITITKINVSKFKTSLKEQVEVQNRQAVRAWLKAVLTEVPGYTHTARGTLVPVGRLVKRAIKRVPATGGRGSARRAKKKKNIWYKDKKFRAGFSYGKNYASASISTKLDGISLRSTFTFTNSLPYVAYNDVNSAPPGFKLPSNPPWGARRKGVDAWGDYIKTEARRKLPVPNNSIKVTRRKVAGSKSV